MSHPDEDALDWLGGGEEEPPPPIRPAAKKPQPPAKKGTAPVAKSAPLSKSSGSRPPLNVNAAPAPSAAATGSHLPDAAPSDDVLAWLAGSAPASGNDTLISPA